MKQKSINLNEKQLHRIVAESITKVLSENELLPNGTKSTAAKTAWEALYNSLENIKAMMNNTYQGKKGNIGVADVQSVVEYINTTINNCLSSTLPNLMK